jgi:hypothetical protein
MSVQPTRNTTGSVCHSFGDRPHTGATVQATVRVSGDLAAQLTCLFWLETTETLRKAENWTPSSAVKRMSPDAIPTPTFQKWAVTVLSMTQVTPNAILLALMFIYRLKTLNPSVKGKVGSEYSLLTVALMLGTKCKFTHTSPVLGGTDKTDSPG